MKQDDEGKFVTVAGKISAWCYGRLSRILRKRGLNIYQMIQNFCDSIVRNMDDKHNLTPESEKMMETFEHMIGWENNFNLADPNTKPEDGPKADVADIVLRLLSEVKSETVHSP